MKNKDVHELIPSPERLIESLRDIGYDFHTAVADIVDNSIEAGASRVNIWFNFDGDDSYVRIADNGRGMNEIELKEAMRYGSEKTYYKEEDLGKFGLGLKTASTSQCRCFSVASRTSKLRRNIISFCWDQNHIKKTHKWEILRVRKKDVLEILESSLTEHTGTVVLWERLDKIIGFKQPYGEKARQKMVSMCRELEEHLAMVFHKFIAKETSRKKLSIFINDNEIKSWDPFARQEPKTKKLSTIKIPLEHDNIFGEISIQSYILPAKNEFTSQDAFKHSSGPGGWNQQQGFYIYRANRMIQSGGWCRLRVRDEHIKLSRIELNFSPKFDSAFRINVAKMQVQLPVQIRDLIREAIGPAVSLAKKHYDRKEPTTIHPTDYGLKSKNTVIDSKKGDIEEPSSPALFTLDEIEKKASDLATKKEKRVIYRIFNVLRKTLIGGKNK